MVILPEEIVPLHSVAEPEVLLLQLVLIHVRPRSVLASLTSAVIAVAIRAVAISEEARRVLLLLEEVVLEVALLLAVAVVQQDLQAVVAEGVPVAEAVTNSK